MASDLKKDINVEMGARIKEKRRSLKFTRERLAELADISPQFLAGIECGKKGMSFATLKKLCECLDLSCDYVILGKSSENPRERLNKLLLSIDERYIPFVESMLADAIGLISAAQKD